MLKNEPIIDLKNDTYFCPSGMHSDPSFYGVTSEWVNSCRKRYLRGMIRILSEKLETCRRDYVEVARRKGSACCEALIYSGIGKEYKAELTKTKKKLKFVGKKDELITLEMIENAKMYPIKEIVPVNKCGYALCVNHDDKHPSMYTKKNYAFCFTCGYTADTIQLYRDVNNCSFIEAVKNLQN